MLVLYLNIRVIRIMTVEEISDLHTLKARHYLMGVILLSDLRLIASDHGCPQLEIQKYWKFSYIKVWVN